jgi:molecular chaperone Hsp31 and glyoxalase 3
VGEPKESFICQGEKICVFPDSLDTGANIEIGCISGSMPWLVGEKLRALGVEILNTGITGECHQDRKLTTGDSLLATNHLGVLAADALLRDVGG